MKAVKRLSLLVGALLSFAASANSVWHGSYGFDLDLSGGIPDRLMFVEYVLSIDEQSCLLSIQGYQVFETIMCDAKDDKKALGIYFKSYEDGSVKNAYGVELYKPGQRLFWLDNELVTHWDALVPDESVAKPGKYFLKKAQ
ncbi:DUF5991 domain-containing protein [Cellvibrio sp. pealriver]|uniref:DUF5991 domain-containing protein n=1 Tax=Cellvibrio sp. pealriver TaxID=1622269 RepID=UPI00066FC59E|nr:DUF5991 domain-containing protein [Cellvibrio sp. pealriver]